MIGFILKKVRGILRYNRINKKIKFGSFWNFVHGFSEETVLLNGITRENYKSFLSDRRYRYSHPYNGEYSSIIDNKLYLPYLLKNYPEHTPKYFYFLNEGIFVLDKKNGVAGFDGFLDVLRKNGRLVLKHTSSSFGQGFHLVEIDGDGLFLLDKKNVTETDLRTFILSLKDYVVSEYVQQHKYAQDINASSLNTIRMLCVWDDSINGFYVARCFHRFGSNGSLVDNLGGGNACLHFVDIATGCLESDGMINKDNNGERFSEHVIHASGRDLSGIQIPGFDEIKGKVIEISNSLPFLKYVGWDIAVTENGFKIIESNSLTSLGILQRKGGFLDDPRLRRLFIRK